MTQTLTVHAFTDRLSSLLVPVPSIGSGVCRRCRGPVRPGQCRCASCDRVERGLAAPCARVVPITLYQIPGPLHTVLRGYKARASAPRPTALRAVPALPGSGVSAWPGLARPPRVVVASLLARFLWDHGRCVAGEQGWDALTVVPSSSHPGTHPMEQALAHVPWLDSQPRVRLVGGTGRVAHRRPSDHAFTVAGQVSGARVIVLDDTWTTGARAQSAASALAAAGAVVAAIVVVGRVVDPLAGEHAARCWSAACRRRFTFATCCLEDALHQGEP